MINDSIPTPSGPLEPARRHDAPPRSATKCSRPIRPKRCANAANKSFANDPENPPEIGANSRTIPGILTQRGCTYAGCRGVVIGPIHDIVHITHGPVGCSYYSWLTRRNLARPKEGVCQLPPLLHDHRHAGGPHRLRRGKTPGRRHPRGLRVFPPEGHRRLCHLPGRPDRR